MQLQLRSLLLIEFLFSVTIRRYIIYIIIIKIELNAYNIIILQIIRYIKTNQILLLNRQKLLLFLNSKRSTFK